MQLKSMIVAAILAFFGITLTAQASPTWTVSTTGYIVYGYDIEGTFGTAGRDLAGLRYTQAITASTDPSLYSATNSLSEPTSNILSGTGPTITDTITVDGVTKIFSGLPGYDEYEALLQDIGTSSRLTIDGVESFYSGMTAAGDSLVFYNYVYSYSRTFISSLNFDDSFSLLINPDDTNKSVLFSISGQQNIYIAGFANIVEVNVEGPTDSTRVPEPESIALLALGMLALASSRKKLQK